LDRGETALYLAAVVVSAWYGDFWSGLLATVASVIVSDYLFIHPAYSFGVHRVDDALQLTVFALVAFLVNVLNTARKRQEAELKKLNGTLADRVREATSRLSLLYDITRAANESEHVAHAFGLAAKRLCGDELWRLCRVFQPQKGTSTDFVLASSFPPERQSTLPSSFECSRLVRKVIASGEPSWVGDLSGEPQLEGYEAFAKAGFRSAVAFPVKSGKEVVAVFECLGDRPLEKGEQLIPVLASVGLELGQVVERRQLQEGYTEAVWEQQKRIAQELHDSLGQELSGVAYLTKSLANSLQEKEQSEIAEMATEGIGRAIDQIRGMAKGVLPVDLDSEGLMSALSQLAESTAAVYGINCTFKCEEPVFVEDNGVALHLYRIAQEAVTNAVKHGKPTQVIVNLTRHPDSLSLVVEDNGCGLQSAKEPRQGSGIRIMKYRAAAMGATFSVEESAGGGTRVACILSTEGSERHSRVSGQDSK
jgi:signal transduction histidine kinase